MRKQDLIFKILQAQTEKSGLIFAEGVLECLPDGFGFLRAPDYNYLPGPGRHLRVALARSAASTCAPATPSPARSARPRKASATSRCIKVDAINFEHPEVARNKIFFDNLTPLYPQERLKLEVRRRHARRASSTCSTPIGKGQRGLIVAPPRTGKTMLLQNIANAIDDEPPGGRSSSCC